MRCEIQPIDDVRVSCEVVDDGTGLDGLTVVATLRRTSDGQYLQSGGGWGASPSNLSLTEPSAADQPGLYAYQVDPDDLTPSDGHYLAKITEATQSLLEYLRIVPTLSAANQRRNFDATNCCRFVPSAWDSTTKQPTAGTIYVYASQALYDADTNEDGTGSYDSWEVEASFNAGRLQIYGRKPA